MSNATITKDSTTSYLDGRNIKYHDDSDDRGVSLFLLLNHKTLHPIHVFFDDDGNHVGIVSMLPVRVPDGKLLDALDAVNSINSKFRFVHFYVDTSDNTIMSRVDAVVDPSTAGFVIFDLLCRTCVITDDALPGLLKVLLPDG